MNYRNMKIQFERFRVPKEDGWFFHLTPELSIIKVIYHRHKRKYYLGFAWLTLNVSICLVSEETEFED